MNLDIPSLPTIQFENYANLPETSAVYFALSHIKDILYIGTACNLHIRWKRHHKFHELQQYRCGYIAWYECTVKEMYAIEREVIAIYRPILNKQKSSFQVPIVINGERVRKARCDLSMTLGELARRTGLRSVYIERIERGLPKGYYIPTLHSLCQNLNVQPSYLLDIARS